MTPREWKGCVVGVRDGETSGATDAHADTIRRAWRGARTGRLRRVVLRHFGRLRPNNGGGQRCKKA